MFDEQEVNDTNNLDMTMDDINPTPVDKVRSVGIIRGVKLSNPNEKGNQYLSFGIEYPIDSPDKNTIYGGISYNSERMREGAANADLSPQSRGWYNKVAGLLKKLRVAASTPDKTVKSFGDLEGATVGFVAGPRFDDVTAYEFKEFYSPKN